MKKFWFIGVLLVLLSASLSAASTKKKNVFELGTRLTIGNMMMVKSNSTSKSEFVTYMVPKVYIEYRRNWLGLEVSGCLGDTNPYNFGEVKETVFPTMTLKGHADFDFTDLYLGLGWQIALAGGSWEYTSTNGTKTKYPVVASGSGFVVQVGATFPLFWGLRLGLDGEYTPMRSFDIEFSKTNKMTVSNVFNGSAGISYLW